jgi:hypothetical protein
MDHKPLIPLFSDLVLGNIKNMRLFDLKENLLRYKFSVAHIPRKEHLAPDAMSR